MSTAHATPINDEVVRLRDQLAGQAPADVLAVFAAEQRSLDVAGPPASVARPPTPFPRADLLDADGHAVSTGDVLAGRPTVVVFYRGAWCPYCNVALRAYQQLLPELAERGVGLVAISPQKPDGSLATRRTNELSFTVLSDPGCGLAAELGIATAPSDDAVAAQSALGLDLRGVNAGGTRAVPMPTVALVDGAGILQWIDVHPNYTTRTEPEQILAALDALLPAPGSNATTAGLTSLAPQLESLAVKLGVKSVLVMRSDVDDMVVAATAGPAAMHYRVGDAGPKAKADPGLVPLYCERVVDSGETTFVQDSRTDETFAGNADQVEFGLINYLGLPVRGADGRVVGTVCVLDEHARVYDDEARRELEQLRDDVESITQRDATALEPASTRCSPDE